METITLEVPEGTETDVGSFLVSQLKKLQCYTYPAPDVVGMKDEFLYLQYEPYQVQEWPVKDAYLLASVGIWTTNDETFVEVLFCLGDRRCYAVTDKGGELHIDLESPMPWSEGVRQIVAGMTACLAKYSVINRREQKTIEELVSTLSDYGPRHANFNNLSPL